MALDTDLSRRPYFDDYDVTKNFYRVLYRPAVAVQARELNQMQTILQDQIDKFGRHIFKEGSVIEGCSFTFDNNYDYVKIKDNYANNLAISSIEDFNNRFVRNDNGLQALIVNTYRGYESQAPDLNTLYIKYINTGVFPNSSVQSAFANAETLQIVTSSNVNIGNVTVATVSNSTGKGYAFTTTEGVIFKKGFFIRVEPQTLIVSRYSNVPDAISVGFDADEQIITPEIDSSLLDNAAGSPNYDAPGAYRLKLVPNLVTRLSSDVSNTTTFFSLVDFKNGLPISIKNDPQYAALGKETARRTYETNGDYVVNPFLLSAEKKYVSGAANTDYLSVVASPGIGYVKGYRVEFINNNTADLRKATDYATVNNQIVTASFGYYFNVDEFVGDFNSDALVQVELHNEAKNAITDREFLTTAYSSSNKIGTAYVRSVAYDSGTPGVDAVYRLYVSNISMSAGQKISDVRSIIYYDSGVKGVADIVLDKDFQGNDVAKIQDSASELMVYRFGQKAIRPEGFSSSADFVYRNKESTTLGTGGSGTLTLSAAIGTGSEAFNYSGVLSTTSEKSFIVTPSANVLTANKTGTINVSSSAAYVNGTSTTFSTEYTVGDYIYSNTETRRIISITNNTLLTVDSAFTTTATGKTHQKVWPAGIPINFTPSGRTITITSSTTATINLGETLSTSYSAVAYFDVLRSSTIPISKTVNRTSYIKIQANTNSGGTRGPWCLGIPDVLKLNAVYVDSTGGTYSASNPNQVNMFKLDNGQRDSYYGLSSLTAISPVAPNATLLVSVDNFTFDTSQGRGFFTAASYPLDDANTANTNAIRTYEIPKYTSTLGSVIDLRDSVDFRPYASNTANVTSTIGNATTNPSNTLTLFSYSTTGSYLPSPDSNFETDLQYYYARKDRVTVNPAGEIQVHEGTPSVNPSAPPEVPGTMTLGIASIPPYPSLIPSDAKAYDRYDYAVQLTTLQTKRYTMADINKISKRVDKLEYYTSLSLLEQATTSLQVRSSATGQNRFKNGILVDPFKDHTIGSTTDPRYKIAVDNKRNEARPYFRQQTTSLVFDSTASDAEKNGDLITLPYTATNAVVASQQIYASKFRNCIDAGYYTYRGSVTLDPPGLVDADIREIPNINGSIEQYPNWVNQVGSVESRFGTSWNNWTDYGSSVTQNDGATLTLNPVGGNYTTEQWLQNTTSTLSQQQQSISKSFTSQSSETNVEIGNYVTDVSIQPYVPPIHIFFSAKGLKPNTRLYAYFDSINVSADCLPLAAFTETPTTVGGIRFTDSGAETYVYQSKSGDYYSHTLNWGDPLETDSSGNLYGIFAIQSGVFTSGDLEFRLSNISSIDLGESSVTTQASTSFPCSPLSIQKLRSDLQIRSSSINIEEEKLNRSVQQTQTTNRSWESISAGSHGLPDEGKYIDQVNVWGEWDNNE